MNLFPVPIVDEISNYIAAAFKALHQGLSFTQPSVKRCDNSKFGDYQSEFALAVAKSIKLNPMVIAESLSVALKNESLFSSVEVAKPGFLNFTVSDKYLEKKALELSSTSNRAAMQFLEKETIVLDYSSPNVAKKMHIGHFRATVIGDSICRVLRYCGGNVIADNHLGDYGTQFGKLIVAYRKWNDPENYNKDPVAELERLYQKFVAEKDDALENEARKELVKLQHDEPSNKALWQEFVGHSLAEFNKIYDKLNVKFDTTLGESFYQPWLAEVVEALIQKGIAHADQGAIIVDTDGRYEIHGPVLVRKSDGAYIYATTDLAAVAYRYREYNPSRIIYLTDVRQQDHLKSVFAIADEWLEKRDVKKIHIWFGSIKGKDGRPFSTREGNAVSLDGIIDEAVQRARAVVEAKNPTLPEIEKEMIAETVGLSSMKYFELNHDLKTDTIFDWDRMLSLEGNTAPYQLYTHARIRSVLRKCEETNGEFQKNAAITIQLPVERNIIMLLDQFSTQIKAAASDLKPNFISEYLNKLSGEFNFYYNLKDAPIVKEPNSEVRASRAAIYMLVGDTIKSALSMLGINALERM
jgi:arginyl-tRNA synthetase